MPGIVGKKSPIARQSMASINDFPIRRAEAACQGMAGRSGTIRGTRSERSSVAGKLKSPIM
jgi:hypothetical protein